MGERVRMRLISEIRSYLCTHHCRNLAQCWQVLHSTGLKDTAAEISARVNKFRFGICLHPRVHAFVHTVSTLP